MPAMGPGIQVISQVQTSQGAIALDLVGGLRRVGGLARPPPRIAAAFFRRTGSAAVSASARCLRANSRSKSLTRFFSSLVAHPGRALLARSRSFDCSHADRQGATRAGYSPRLRQYSPKSASLRDDVSSTATNLSREDQPSGPASASGKSCPLPRASPRHLCSVTSEIPSSCDNCRMAMWFGGSIRFCTADLRSSEYPKSSYCPANLKIRACCVESVSNDHANGLFMENSGSHGRFKVCFPLNAKRSREK